MKTKPKRNKAYKPKHIQVPFMPDLQREFQIAMHGSLAALRLAPNAEALDQLADLFNVIFVALQDTGGRSLILDSGMRAMQEVCDRVDRTGKISMSRFELPPIENAVLECEEIVSQLDIIRLYQARVKVIHAARVTRAIANHAASERAAACPA